jgi:hypothetical protein
MKRIEALRVIDEAYSDRPLVITGGATARELARVGVRDNHLYLSTRWAPPEPSDSGWRSPDAGRSPRSRGTAPS